MSSKKAEKTVVDYASVSYTTVAGSGPDATNIVVQNSVDITKGEDHINAEMDKMARALERQREIGNIKSYEENIYNCENQIKFFEEDIKGMKAKAAAVWNKSNRTGDPKLSQNDEQRERELLKEIKRLKDNMQEWQNKLLYAVEVRDGVNKAVAKAVKSA